MNCEKALILISATLDGELTEAERQALENHLAQCSECRGLSEDFGVLSVALSDMEAPPPSELTQRVEAALNGQGVSSSTNKAQRKKISVSSLVATIAAVLCLGSAYTFWQRNFTISGDSAATSASENSPDTQNHNTTSDSFTQSPTNSHQESASQGQKPVEQSNDGAAFGDTSSYSMDPSDTGQSQESVQSGNVAEKDSVTIESQQQAGAPAESPIVNGTFQPPVSQPSSQFPEETAPIGSISPDEDISADQESQLTPLQALDLAFTHLGGWIQFPKAALDEAIPAYFLQRVEEENLTSDWWLKYEGLSPNGLYHIFRQYEYIVVNGADGWAHTSTINHFAISLEGLFVFSQYDADRTSENTSAYHQAIGS